jgi:hypothetical protein
MVTSGKVDRYITFKGLSCDGSARRIVDRIQQHLDQPIELNPWVEYFKDKLAQRHALGQDELFFVGSQITQIHDFLEQYGDTEALELLEQVEEECC